MDEGRWVAPAPEISATGRAADQQFVHSLESRCVTGKPEINTNNKDLNFNVDAVELDFVGPRSAGRKLIDSETFYWLDVKHL